MNRWEKLFNEHPIHQVLEPLLEFGNQKTTELSAEAAIEVRRFSKVIKAFKNTLQKLDPELTPFNHLDSLNKNLSQDVLGQVNSYNSNSDAGHITNANNAISNLIASLSVLLAISRKSVAEKPRIELEKIVDEFGESVFKKKEELQEQVNELELSVSEMKEEMDKQLDDIGNNTAQHKEELEGLGVTIETRSKETETYLTKWQEQFSNASYGNFWCMRNEEAAHPLL